VMELTAYGIVDSSKNVKQKKWKKKAAEQLVTCDQICIYLVRDGGALVSSFTKTRKEVVYMIFPRCFAACYCSSVLPCVYTQCTHTVCVCVLFGCIALYAHTCTQILCVCVCVCVRARVYA